MLQESKHDIVRYLLSVVVGTDVNYIDNDREIIKLLISISKVSHKII